MIDKSQRIKGKWATKEVFIGDKKLSPEKSQNIMTHNSRGFDWGYGGSGAAQLALALLLEITTEEQALKLYQFLKWSIIFHLPNTDFEIPIAQIFDWLNIYGG